MTPEDQAVQDAINAHAALVSELESIKQEERRLEDRLKQISRRKDELKPWGYRIGSGLIDRAEAHIADAKRKLEDATKPRLTIKRGEFAVPPTIDVVLVKVTPKRIYVREAGSDFETYIPRDGSQMHYGWQVDMDALLKWAGCAQTVMATEAT